jgi:hypothetical protein
MPFDERAFAADFDKHLRALEKDIETLRALPPEDRNSVLGRVLNLRVNVKGVPEFVEGWALATVVGMIDGWISKQFSAKERSGPLPPKPGRGTVDYDDYQGEGPEFD